jgi:hypothetical protein
MREWERNQMEEVRSCANHQRDLEWELQEEEMNKRMDIIGQNGNTGEHYA